MINGLLVWYAIRVLQKLSYVYDNISTIQEINNSFVEHLESVHEMEMYYGDENLKSLIDHSREVINDFIDFQEKYFDVEVQIESDEEEQSEQDEEETSEKEE